MRILFAGGKNVGCGCLEVLLDHPEVEIVGVYVNPDSDAAPDRWYRSAGEIARHHRIPVFAAPNINAPEEVARISGLHPELVVVAYYDQILKPSIIELPPRGCVNLHLALAEEYRGCYPTTWPILNGETRTGVTLHYIDEGIDSGDIIAQRIVEITAGDTGRSLYDKCTEAGVALFRETLPLLLAGNAPRRKQVTTDKTRYYKRAFPPQCVDLAAAGPDVYNAIRAVYFPPFPLPHFYIGDTKMVIVEESRLTNRPERVPIALETTACLNCGSEDYEERHLIPDRVLRAVEGFPVVQCRNCGLQYLRRRPRRGDLARYYAAGYHVHRVPKAGPATRVQTWLREREVRRYTKGLRPNTRILDFGAGLGLLTQRLANHGWNVTGVEASPQACAEARRRHGVELVCGDIESLHFPDAQFQCVIMLQVIEHLPDPLAALREIRRILEPGGRLIVSTINVDSISCRVFGADWLGYTEAPMHLSFFSEKTLLDMLRRAGFSVRQIRHFMVPNDWIHSLRRRLEGHRATAAMARTLSHQNLFWSALFAPLGLACAAVHTSARIEIQAGATD